MLAHRSQSTIHHFNNPNDFYQGPSTEVKNYGYISHYPTGSGFHLPTKKIKKQNNVFIRLAQPKPSNPVQQKSEKKSVGRTSSKKNVKSRSNQAKSLVSKISHLNIDERTHEIMTRSNETVNVTDNNDIYMREYNLPTPPHVSI